MMLSETPMKWDKDPLDHLDVLLLQGQLHPLQHRRQNLQQLGSASHLNTFC